MSGGADGAAWELKHVTKDEEIQSFVEILLERVFVYYRL
jgi:hypothetical protein